MEQCKQGLTQRWTLPKWTSEMEVNSCWKRVYWWSVQWLFLQKKKQGERQPRPQILQLTREVIAEGGEV